MNVCAFAQYWKFPGQINLSIVVHCFNRLRRKIRPRGNYWKSVSLKSSEQILSSQPVFPWSLNVFFLFSHLHLNYGLIYNFEIIVYFTLGAFPLKVVWDLIS